MPINSSSELFALFIAFNIVFNTTLKTNAKNSLKQFVLSKEFYHLYNITVLLK